MASPDFTGARLPPILERLIERTEARELKWEIAALTDAYAVSIGEVRFRVRSMSGDGSDPYILEFLTQPAPPAVVTNFNHEDRTDELVGRLYSVARASVVEEMPDPFDSVEQALGLQSSGDIEAG